MRGQVDPTATAVVRIRRLIGASGSSYQFQPRNTRPAAAGTLTPVASTTSATPSHLALP